MSHIEYFIFCNSCEEVCLCLEEDNNTPHCCPECGSPTIDILEKRELED